MYQKILKFYMFAFEILAKKKAKLIMKIIVKKDRLSQIVEDFLKHVDIFRKFVQKTI